MQKKFFLMGFPSSCGIGSRPPDTRARKAKVSAFVFESSRNQQ